MTTTRTRPKTVVVGLDGAHFELLEPWLEAGELPTLERIFEDGVTADLQSVLPPVTSPNWKAYATGKNPGKIGIFWWENVDIENRRVYYPHDRKHLNTEFWELIAEREPVGVIGVPTTYPPKEVGAFLVAGAPDGKEDGYAYPPELEAELREKFDYRLSPGTGLKENLDEAAREIIDLVDLQFEVGKYLDEKYDPSFLQITTFYTNSLHHYLWDHDYTLQAWKVVDAHLEEFLSAGHNLVLMSDHGSNKIETTFHINTWLEEEGYLVLDEGASKRLHRLGINTDRLGSTIGRLGVREHVHRFVPKRVVDWVYSHVPDEQGELKHEYKGQNIDWDETTVIASGQGPIYLTVPRTDPRYDRIREELVEKLTALRDPRGRRVVDAVLYGEDVYSGQYASEAPDLVVDQAKGVHIPGSVGRDRVFTDPEADGWLGENKRSGLFAAVGPAFGTGRLDELSILDLAPTLLHLHGVPIPDDMDGRVRKAVFAPDSDARHRDVAVAATSARQREVDRIRAVARRLEL